MMDELDSDEFLSEVFTEVKPLEEVTSKNVFRAWHKPRKQWVRYHQWYKGMIKLIDEIKPKNIKEFSYLGLPGDDMLDIRLLSYGCQKKGVRLKYLGFNTVSEYKTSTTELNISESELMKSGNVNEDSKVLHDPIEAISNDKSSAYREAKNLAPYHMINFDLCNSIAKKGTGSEGDTYFKSLQNIIELQLNYMKEPWLLFLTTQVCKKSVIKTAMENLLNTIIDNIKEHKEFSSNFESLIMINPKTVDKAAKNVDELTDQEYFDCFALGFSKWLLSLSKDFQNCKIKPLVSCKYRTGDKEGEPNMLSIGFKFEFIFNNSSDDYKLGHQKESYDSEELEQALDMINEVENIFNLDVRINKNSKLSDDLIKSSADLLENARFDRNAYMTWINKGCPSSN